MQTIEFQQPKDYSIEVPVITIDDCDYKLYDGGSLSEATPKALSETIDMYPLEDIDNSA